VIEKDKTIRRPMATMVLSRSECAESRSLMIDIAIRDVTDGLTFVQRPMITDEFSLVWATLITLATFCSRCGDERHEQKCYSDQSDTGSFENPRALPGMSLASTAARDLAMCRCHGARARTKGLT
jgi:hypothetical protein